MYLVMLVPPGRGSHSQQPDCGRSPSEPVGPSNQMKTRDCMRALGGDEGEKVNMDRGKSNKGFVK